MQKLFLAAGDFHIPYEDKASVNIFNQVVKLLRPDITLSLGDLLDCSQFSSHPPTFGEECTSYEDNLNDARVMIDFWQEYTKDRTVLIEGNHCYSKDTEVLTKIGWKVITEVTPEDLVAQFNPTTREVTFANPYNFTHHREEVLYKLSNNNTCQKVSGGHDVVYFGKKIKANDLVGVGLDSRGFYLNGFLKNKPSGISLPYLKFLTWVIMDGTLVDGRKYNPNTTKMRVQFKLSKPDKISKLRELLDYLGIPYTYKEACKSGINKLQPYYIRIYSDDARKVFDLLEGNKQFPAWFMQLTTEEALSVIEAITDTDGSIRNHCPTVIEWTTINKHNIDIIQSMCILNGLIFKYTCYSSDSSGFANGKPQYRGTFMLHERPLRELTMQLEIIPYADDVYCFSVPEGAFITRVEGKVAFSGNCHRIDRWAAKNQEGRGAYSLVAPHIQLMKTSKGEQRKKCTYVKYGSVDGNYPHYKLNSRIVAVHGWSYCLNAARTHMLLAQGKSILFGHSHRMQSEIGQSVWYNNHNITAMSGGCMCRKVPVYGTGNPVSWVNGFILGYMGRHSDTIYPISINKDYCILPDGKRIEAK